LASLHNLEKLLRLSQEAVRKVRNTKGISRGPSKTTAQHTYHEIRGHIEAHELFAFPRLIRGISGWIVSTEEFFDIETTHQVDKSCEVSNPVSSNCIEAHQCENGVLGAAWSSKWSLLFIAEWALWDIFFIISGVEQAKMEWNPEKKLCQGYLSI